MSIDFPDDPRGRELLLMLERAKYERWLAHEIATLLERAFNEVVDIILSPRFRTLSVAEQTRKLQLWRELDRHIRSGYEGVTSTVLREMQNYAALEVEVSAAQIASLLGGAGSHVGPSIGAMISGHRVTSIAQLPIQGLNIGDWFEAQAAGMSRETRRILQNGLLQGKSIPDMVKEIVPPRGSVDPTLYRRARHDAMAVTRTTVNAVQNHAALESYTVAGPEVSDSYRLLVVRDARTSAICRGLSNRVFRYDDPKRMVPPFHMNCRTTPIPLVKNAFLSLTAQRNTQHTMGAYGAWLGQQSKPQQDLILGPTHGEWWRNGKMTLADAIDEDNRVLTLAQLRKRLPVSDTRREPVGAGF